MPIDGSMVPLPQLFFPYRMSREGMIDGGGNVAEKHSDKIQYHTGCCPASLLTETPDKENRTEHHAQYDSTAMTP